MYIGASYLHYVMSFAFLLLSSNKDANILGHYWATKKCWSLLSWVDIISSVLEIWSPPIVINMQV